MRLARGLTFSWKRAVGLTAARQRLSKQIGIPTTRNGIERKVGRMALSGAGCLVPLLIGLLVVVWLLT